MGGGLLLALPTMAGAADTRSNRQDIAILNFALTLEYLEAEFYVQAQASNFGMRTGQFANVAGQHEAEHVDFLTNALGNRAVKKPAFAFGNAVTDPVVFRNTAVRLEDTGVAAYTGQIHRLKRTAFILAAVVDPGRRGPPQRVRAQPDHRPAALGGGLPAARDHGPGARGPRLDRIRRAVIRRRVGAVRKGRQRTHGDPSSARYPVGGAREPGLLDRSARRRKRGA